MNVAIDVRPVERPSSRHRGVGFYTKHLCDGLLKRNQSLRQPHAFTVVTSQFASMWEGQASVSRMPTIPKPSRLQWLLDTWALPRSLRQNGLDIFHATE